MFVLSSSSRIPDPYFLLEASLVAQMVKNLPAMQETLVQSPGWEDPLEMEMATHSSILAWRIPWTEKPARLRSMGLQRVGHDSATNTISSLRALDLSLLGPPNFLSTCLGIGSLIPPFSFRRITLPWERSIIFVA